MIINNSHMKLKLSYVPMQASHMRSCHLPFTNIYHHFKLKLIYP